METKSIFKVTSKNVRVQTAKERDKQTSPWKRVVITELSEPHIIASEMRTSKGSASSIFVAFYMPHIVMFKGGPPHDRSPYLPALIPH